jgi:hypothetical protein
MVDSYLKAPQAFVQKHRHLQFAAENLFPPVFLCARYLSTNGRVCHWKFMVTWCCVNVLLQFVPVQPDAALVVWMFAVYASERLAFGPNGRVTPPPTYTES